MPIAKCGLSPSPAPWGRVGVGAKIAKRLSAPLPTSPRSLREQGEEHCTSNHDTSTHDFHSIIADTP